ncbi:MAG: hypothetical protein LBP53_00105 [Candidatus Peribacteria bacterium]|jgi:tRNA G10  N-methylase Trm11|nr:hypothetical protein [Candidatus Peribacteria bacterium]
MMPAKLTHALINIGIASLKKRTKMLPEQLLIFDPFCGTGTTGFVANALGYHFIGSDIKLNFALQNQQRRKQTQHYHHQLFSFIEQDISKPLDADKFQELLTHQTLIITEGRL